MAEPYKILVVEDERIVAEDIKESLESLEYEVVSIVSSGKEAIDKARLLKPDIVMMDIVLHGKLNGIDTAENIHTQLNIPVIFLTAYADKITVDRAKLTQPYGYIVKPFDNKELSSTIEIALYKHKMEQKLKENEAWLSTTLKSIGDAVITTDVNGIITFINPVAEFLTGWKYYDAVNKPLETVFHIINEHTKKEVVNPVIKVLKNGLVIGLANDTLLIAKNGKNIPIDDSGAPIKDENGKIIGVILVFHDISERKKVEGALRESEKKYRILVENALEGILLVKPHPLKIIFANKQAAKIFGFTQEELISLNSKYIERFIYHEDRKTLLKKMEELVNGMQPGIRKMKIIRKNQEVRWVKVFGHPTEYGGETVIQIEIEDVTDQRVAEQGLKESEEKYRKLYNDAPVGYHELDHRGRIMQVNQTEADLLGYNRRELIGKYIWDLIAPDQRQAAKKSIKEKLLKQRITGRVERKYIRKDGDEIDVLVEQRLVMDSKGNVTGIRSIFHDITERKQMEKEREKLQTQLQHSQKLEAIGTLAGGVAHDFNNLLTIIQGNTDLAMMEVSKTDPIYKTLKQINITTIRAAALVRQLLLFGRKHQMEFVPLNINKTIEDMLKMLRRIIGENIKIRKQFKPDLWTINADEGNLQQLMMNLAVNARDAMPDGGILSIKTENIEVTENYCKKYSYARPGKYICLSITDTGTGIEKDILPHIFDPFFTTKEIGKGTGLGLSVVYGIIKQHEGWINVESEPGKGSTFKVYIKAVPMKPEQRDKQAITSKKLKGKGEKILLVEDEENVRKLIMKLLKENNYIVFDAANAEEAIQIFKKQNGDFKLIFSDLLLPGENGIQLVESLTKEYPDLAVLLGSGYSNWESYWPIIQRRGYQLIHKPYDFFEILKAIKYTIKNNSK
jgi:two-component system cell cycle sensor histidine kinase/response regulator CckA